MRTFSKFLVTAVALSSTVFALSAGDIAILGMNTDNPDDFVFVALANIPANTVITFTDCGWSNSTAAFRVGEHAWTWTHNADVAAGTVIVMRDVGATAWSVISGPGTAAESPTGFGSNRGFSTSGDQILAYEGNGWSDRPTSSSDTKWLAAISTRGWTTTGADSSNSSDLPTALAGYALSFTETSSDIDNGYFASGTVAQTSVTIAGTKSQLWDHFSDGANMYYKNNTGPLSFPTYNISVIPEPGAIVLGGLMLLAALRRR